MNLLFKIIGGVLNLLGKIIGAILGVVISLIKTAFDAGMKALEEKKKQKQLENNVDMLDKFMQSCIESGKKSVLDTIDLLTKACQK